jgi:hypothetical protein
MEWRPALLAGVGGEFFRTEEFQKMKSFVPAFIFAGLYFADTEGDHFIGGKRQGKMVAVDIHNIIYGAPSVYFLHVSLGKHNKKLMYEHKKIIMNVKNPCNTKFQPPF